MGRSWGARQAMHDHQQQERSRRQRPSAEETDSSEHLADEDECGEAEDDVGKYRTLTPPTRQ